MPPSFYGCSAKNLARKKNRSKNQERAPRKVGSVFVETQFSAKDCVRSAIIVLKEVGINPDEVKVELPMQY